MKSLIQAQLEVGFIPPHGADLSAAEGQGTWTPLLSSKASRTGLFQLFNAFKPPGPRAGQAHGQLDLGTARQQRDPARRGAAAMTAFGAYPQKPPGKPRSHLLLLTLGAVLSLQEVKAWSNQVLQTGQCAASCKSRALVARFSQVSFVRFDEAPVTFKGGLWDSCLPDAPLSR